jgi:hypothetical protein
MPNTVKTLPILFASAFAYSAAVHFDPVLHVHPEMPAPVWPDNTVASMAASGGAAAPLVTNMPPAKMLGGPVGRDAKLAHA